MTNSVLYHSYNPLLYQVRKETPTGQQRAHTIVEVTVEDENDNSPMFVQQPYHAVLVYDAPLGHVVKQVSCLIMD